MKNIYEVFSEFEQRTTDHDRLCVLKYNNTYALKSILKAAFDPNVKFAITKIPEYHVSDAPPGLGYNSIHQEINRAYLFEANNPRTPKITEKRREEILIQILESMEEHEAKIFADMLMKRIEVKGLTYNIVKEAFPDILP